ncbi:MAG: class I SAM-dependent RNA methyltransferase [Spirochaetaceae bacterium]|jgi:23S rRNA (uracil1939-C5)-methyltransferase|nr:class I SAM-dependent RNA methyltransferase [Spirochaetaceae bacterium]
MCNRTVFEGRVESISFSGGVIRFDGRAFFVPFACPGDVIRARTVNGQKHAAQLVEIIEPSPNRADPPCALFGICGGCTLQHIAYAEQIEQKRKLVADSLRRIGGLDTPPAMTMVTSPPYGYRNRVELHTDGRITGFKQAKSAKIIPAPVCPAAVPVIRDYLRIAAQPSRARKGLPIQPPARYAVYGFDDRLAVEGSRAEKLFVPGLGITMDARLFFQSNLALQTRLVADVAAAAGEGEAAADLYCGVGAFARPLSARFQKLCLVEENPAAIALARENLRNTPAAAEYYALSLEKYCAMLDQNTERPAPRWDAAVVDPPREGLSPPLTRLLIRLQTPRLVYVSCNPVTLARDLKRLLDGGYTLDSITCYDFYPQTLHLESLALLTHLPWRRNGGVVQ